MRHSFFLSDRCLCPVASDVPTFSLIRLPKSFVELYGLVNKVKGRDYTTGFDDSDDAGNTETAICLLTGEVMRAGSLRRNRAVRLEVVLAIIIFVSSTHWCHCLLVPRRGVLVLVQYMPGKMGRESVSSFWFRNAPCY